MLPRSRLGEVVEWLGGGDGDPLIILDECHRVRCWRPCIRACSCLQGAVAFCASSSLRKVWLQATSAPAELPSLHRPRI